MYETYVLVLSLVPTSSVWYPRGCRWKLQIAAQELALWSQNYIRMRSFSSFAPELFINLDLSPASVSIWLHMERGMVEHLLPYRRIRPYRHPLFFFPFPIFCHFHPYYSLAFLDTGFRTEGCVSGREIRPIDSRYD